MRNYILTFLLTLLLIIDPSHFTSSSEITNEGLTYEEYVKFDRQIKIIMIKYKIEKETELFNLNLNTINTPKFAKNFILDLSCDALDSKSLPSISIAQASLETGYGRYLKLENNIFGIKGKGIKSKTKEFVNGRYITIYSEFQHFKTRKLAFERHFEIIKRYGVKGDNYIDWISVIVLNGYATDPLYDKKLKFIINRYQLDRLDRIQKLNLELKKYDRISQV